MPSIAFAAPILPGKTEADREAIRSCADGERRAEFEASRGLRKIIEPKFEEGIPILIFGFG